MYKISDEEFFGAITPAVVRQGDGFIYESYRQHHARENLLNKARMFLIVSFVSSPPGGPAPGATWGVKSDYKKIVKGLPYQENFCVHACQESNSGHVYHFEGILKLSDFPLDDAKIDHLVEENRAAFSKYLEDSDVPKYLLHLLRKDGSY